MWICESVYMSLIVFFSSNENEVFCFCVCIYALLVRPLQPCQRLPNVPTFYIDIISIQALRPCIWYRNIPFFNGFGYTYTYTLSNVKILNSLYRVAFKSHHSASIVIGAKCSARCEYYIRNRLGDYVNSNAYSVGGNWLDRQTPPVFFWLKKIIIIIKFNIILK